MKVILVSILLLLVGCSSSPKVIDLQRRYQDQLIELSDDPSLDEFKMEFRNIAEHGSIKSDLRTSEQLKRDIEMIKKWKYQVLLGSVNQLRNQDRCHRVFNVLHGSAGASVTLYVNERGETILATRSVTFY